MDFFEAQDRARRNTGKLVALYLVAVVLIILSVYLISGILFGYVTDVPRGSTVWEQFWHPGLLISVSAIIIITLIIGTTFRVLQLRKGGSAVAEMLGGRKVEPSSTDHHEKRLINIVEEMSIASGVPVPDIYILDHEETINAFAAGFTMNDAAVGVTKGALEKLDRDELQGVIAHEFSHIFNGDMNMNIRLIGILNGILLLHIMGMILMRSAMFSGAMGRGRSSGGRGQGGGNATIAIVLFGLALVAIGYIGMIFGRMIQAAISRQREYLADAAAVQYTRNPEGLAGALRKLALVKRGGKIENGHAMEMSHLFFANSFHSMLNKAFATHPPLEKRIRAIDPAFDEENEQKKRRIREKLNKDHVARSAASETGAATGTGHKALTPEVLLGAIGSIERERVSHAGRLLNDIPERLREAAHEPLGSEALIYALLIAKGDSESLYRTDRLSGTEDSVAAYAGRLLPDLVKGKQEWFLPLAELALPSLRQMSPAQYHSFRTTVQKLVRENSADSLFEFALEKMIIHQLDTAFSDRKSPTVRHHRLKTLSHELSVLLSALAHSSSTETLAAWKAGLEPLGKLAPDTMTLLPPEECGIDQLDLALDAFAASSNPVRKYILSSAVHCVLSDNHITTSEMELLRALSEVMDAPIPLMALGQSNG